MREIKIRYWDKIKKIMIYNNTDFEKLESSEYEYDDPYAQDEYFPICEADFMFARFDEKRFIQMQYIGLKDENRKEIYEGDVVSWEDDYFIIQ